MIRYATTGLALFSVAMAANADEYAEVLSRANGMQKALAYQDRQSLADATVGNLAEAKDVCDKRVGSMHAGMGVVFRINEDGQVTETWTRNDTDYENCFADAMEELIEFVPPVDPFYASMDYNEE